MSSQESSLSRIPVNIEPPKAGNALHWQRRAVQLLTIALFLIIPMSGLFRIDPIAGAFVVLGRQIWWADFFIVFGFWLLVASSLVMLYSTVGTAFCGWSCPQNTLSEWANLLTRKLLGKRAELELDGSKMKVGAGKNTVLNWAVLGVILVLTSALFALIPLFYFYPPDVIWSFVRFHDDVRLAASLHIIYLIFVLVVLLDVAFIRHFWCRFMCVYKVWQHGFKTKQTLHIAYDTARSDLCEKCNYCLTACFVDIDPRQTNTYDTCINCGECVTACNTLQAKKGLPGLLSFKIGEQQASKFKLLSARLGGLSTRIRWTIPFAALGGLLFVWGLFSYEQYHLAVYRADVMQGAQIQDYRIAVSNKYYEPARILLSVEGLPEDSYDLPRSEVQFADSGRVDINLHIKDKLAPGIYRFIVKAREVQDRWNTSYRVQHFVGRK